MKLRKIIFIVSVLFLFTSCMEDIQKMLAPSGTLPTDLSISISNNSSDKISVGISIEKSGITYLNISKDISANGTGTLTVNMKEIYDAISKDFPSDTSHDLIIETIAAKGSDLIGSSTANTLKLSEKTYDLKYNVLTISGTDIAWSSN